MPRRRCVLLLVFLAACGETTPPSVNDAVTISISTHPDSLYSGDTLSLGAQVRTVADGALSSLPIAWSSSDTTVAKVSASGKILAAKPGTAYVRGTVGAYADSVRVHVIAPVSSLTLRAKNFSLPSFYAVTLEPVLLGPGLDTIRGRLVTFTSTDTTVATVSVGGGVQARRPGSAKIGVRSENFSDTALITVIQRVSRVVISGPIAPMAPGDSAQLTFSVLDTFGVAVTGRTATWSSDSPALAAVDPATGKAYVFGVGSPVVRAVVDGVVGQYTFQTTAITLVDLATGFGGCGRTASGTTFCWAPWTYYGSLGNPRIAQNANLIGLAPTVTVAPPLVSLVGSWSYNVCGLTATGSAWCWGYNSSGQLGAQSGCTPAPGGNCSIGPMLVPAGVPFTGLAAGANHSCGLAGSGAIYCWGGGSGSLFSGAPRQVTSAVSFVQVVAGFDHTCGLGTDSLAYCWGSNSSGQTGTGSTSQTISSPTAVSGGQHFASLAAGGNNTCGLTAAGVAWCWGFNGSGQMGSSVQGFCPGLISTACSLTPVQVVGAHVFQTVSVGFNSSCAIATDQRLWCWGGSIGFTPAQPAGGLVPRTVSVGEIACLLATDGRVYCWHPFGSYGLTTTPTRLAGQN